MIMKKCLLFQLWLSLLRLLLLKIIFIAYNCLQLNQLYNDAVALVYPSLYEGFGLPPLEAMVNNCPVICSNTSSIPEVVGNAGQYFNPYDLDSQCNAIEKVVYDTQLRAKLILEGKERINGFSWSKCAHETIEVYKKILK